MSRVSMRHIFSRRGFEARNQALSLTILGVIFLLILGGMYLSQVASFAITNREIEDLISQREAIKRENELLLGEIARYNTVPELYARALELGFRPASKADIEYIFIAGFQPQSAWAGQRQPASAPASRAAPTPAQDFRAWLEQQAELLQTQLDAFRQ